VILENAIENLPCFQSNNIVDARRHVKKVSLCFNKWCCNALYEDVGMKLFILSFDDDDLDWFTKLKDKLKDLDLLYCLVMDTWLRSKRGRFASPSINRSLFSSPTHHILSYCYAT
jgi:hypothetical protein